MEQISQHISKSISLIDDPEKLLYEFVRIDTRFTKQDNITLVQNQLDEILGSLGFQCHYLHSLAPNQAPLLHASMKGTSSKIITFIGHSDVVTTPNQNPFQISQDENIIRGSGVADDKGGLVVCLRTLALYLKKGKPYFNINVIVSPSEERGSLGFHHFFNEIGMKSDYVMGLEPALQDGSLISSRNGNRWMEIEVKGKSCHSGRFGEKHVNAAHELALIIGELSTLNDEDARIRVNVGSLKSNNDIYNIVCGSASAKIDLRFPDFNSREHLEKSITSILAQRRIKCPYSSEMSEITSRIDDDCPPLPQPKQLSDQLIKLDHFISIIEGKSPGFSHAGGAADINYFSHPFNTGVDGLGPIGAKMHTNEEFIVRSSLKTRSLALSRWISSLEILN